MNKLTLWLVAMHRARRFDSGILRFCGGNRGLTFLVAALVMKVRVSR